MNVLTDEKVIYRAAIIGTGRIGSTYDDEVGVFREMAFYQGEMRHPGLYTIAPINHADAYRQTPGFDLVASANRSQDKLEIFGERSGVRALYTNFREMLREEEPDVVSVCTQSAEKAEVTISAAEAGVKAIIVEKAMATTMKEVDDMIAACERNKVLLVVNHPNRFSPVNRRIKELIEVGEIGELGVVSAYGKGGMMHIGTHTFDMVRFWAGDVVEVQAHVPNYVPEKDIAATGTLQFANGVAGFFDHVHGVLRGYEARGTSGYVTTSGLAGDSWLYRSKRLPPSYADVDMRKSPDQLISEPIESDLHTMSLTQRLLRELHQTLSIGAPFVSTAEDGAAALELGLACYVSHLAGGPIRLPLADRSFRVPNR